MSLPAAMTSDSLTTSSGPPSLDEVELRRLFGPFAYVPRWMVQTNLPHKDPGPIASWTRVNGLSRLTIQPFIECVESGDEAIPECTIHHGIPYGAIPRLLLAYIGHQVVTHECPVIDMGSHMTDFMAELGLIPKWGKSATNARLREQVHRFATCKIAVVGPDNSYRNYSFVEALDNCWCLSDQSASISAWQSTLTLTDAAFKDFLSTRVPTNLATLFALKKSVLALDIYNWLSLRLYKLKAPTKRLTYGLLARQFGSQYARERDFERKFVRELRKVLQEYREAKVEAVPGGIRLYPSPPHVPENWYYVQRGVMSP